MGHRSIGFCEFISVIKPKQRIVQYLDIYCLVLDEI